MDIDASGNGNHGPVSCDRCQQSFGTLRTLEFHLQHSPRHNRCWLCGIDFESYQEYRNHLVECDLAAQLVAEQALSDPEPALASDRLVQRISAALDAVSDNLVCQFKFCNSNPTLSPAPCYWKCTICCATYCGIPAISRHLREFPDHAC